MTALGRIRATVVSIVFATMAALAVAPAAAQSPSYMRLSAGDSLENHPVYLGVNKSMVVELPRPAGDVLVSNPAIADAVLRTSTRLYLIGVKLGQANVFLFDAAGTQIASLEIYVEADLGALNQLLAEAIPDGFVRADAMNGNIVLRGQVPSASESSRAMQITVGMLDGSSAGSDESGGEEVEKNVVNLLTITGEEQVALKVTIAEVERDVVKQLGINVSGSLDIDGFSISTLTNGLSPIPFEGGGELGIGFNGDDGSIGANLQALEETRMVRTLAEPTLTAVSGETANFLAGGEFGYQTFDDSVDDNGTISRRVTVAFKPFGVGLAFTPVVLSPGRISLKIRTEVSEIAGTTFGIPFLNTRRAETTVELPSGGSFVIGGLIQEKTRRAATGFPGLQHVPILGALFASKDFLSEETELVMIVTPYLVKPVSPKDLARPDDNLVLAGDAEAYFLNRLTKAYGRATPVPGGAAAGQVGFTFD
jgi:pilus assembly protein CpaC